ncbi:adhesion regulating molecule [Beauveria bassiana ARSEF 2860]|uniref:Adhesion regulating molecule n=1 Tax=Beauveria bassiana (strain ARSEF 2860) TaxID=655819 RepID=J4WID5_BEAB2|nr:adhesion regulating molecule [Beauveria bassiana ARSEF 2860]EJP69605.1 adhesion regulating molecule [Beauveria bassiana ARSEF 2860]
MPTPLINFKAGRCEVDTSSGRPYKVKPQPEPGYISLYYEDDLIKFVWRKRDQDLDEPELDLVMVPADGTFAPYEYKTTPQPTSKTNGRIFVLKFASSSQRYLFWLQSKHQGTDASYLSPRDLALGSLVDRILQGEELSVNAEINAIRDLDNGPDDDDDETMEDAEGQDTGSRQRHGSGGAGAGATGGDVREEGEQSREGGSDDASAAVQRFLSSISGANLPSGAGQRQHADLPYPYLNHLLPTSITVPMVNEASEDLINSLLNYLPPSIILMAADASSNENSTIEPKPAVVEAAKAALSMSQKRALITRVLRSPQFHQALGTLTMALRDGGLPTIAEALGVNLENGGYIQQGGMPLGGGYAVKAFVDGIVKSAKEQQ